MHKLLFDFSPPNFDIEGDLQKTFEGIKSLADFQAQYFLPHLTAMSASLDQLHLCCDVFTYSKGVFILYNFSRITP